MTAASAPEEVVRCWLKVTYNGRTRMIEWSKNQGTFKEMDEKVRKMFGLHERIKLVYSYVEPAFNSDIIMSSDEELATALHFMVGEVLFVTVGCDKRKKKNPLVRAYKQAQPRVREVMARMPSIFVVVAFMREAATRAVSCVSSCFTCRRHPPPAPRIHVPSAPRATHWRLRLSMFLLILAILLACPWIKGHMRNKWVGRHFHNHYYPHSEQEMINHVTILAATYGGRDVTHRAREYYSRVASLKAANDIYGDPLPGLRKHLHVVYQVSSQGFTEVYSQSIPEYSGNVRLTLQKDHCSYPEEAIVDGISVRVIGALYDDVSATCAARRMAATGLFAHPHRQHKDYYRNENPRDSVIKRQNFGSDSPNGVFTLVYVKDNTLRVSIGREGGQVEWY